MMRSGFGLKWRRGGGGGGGVSGYQYRRPIQRSLEHRSAVTARQSLDAKPGAGHLSVVLIEDEHQHRSGNADNDDKNAKDEQRSQPSCESFVLRLDDRRLTLHSSQPIVIDRCDLCLMIAAEFEAQSIYIRLESMPLTEMVAVLLIRQQGLSAMPADIQRTAWKESVTSRLVHDLLLTAESRCPLDDGFYGRHWQPVIDWFNTVFGTSLVIDTANLIMDGEPGKDNLATYEI
ncbi:MAG: hypothetical protein GY826_43180 [Fuerstiella sp.]|nr:hypothetical protein [Fuerstiella sp.]